MFVPNEYRIENHAKRIIKALKKENKYNPAAEEKIKRASYNLFKNEYQKFESIETLTEKLKLIGRPIKEQIKLKYEFLLGKEEEYWDNAIYYLYDEDRYVELPMFKISTLGRCAYINKLGYYSEYNKVPEKNIYTKRTIDLSKKPTLVVIHRIVGSTFIPIPDDCFKIGNGKPELNHIDGVKFHNGKSNLEWVTQSDNSQHAVNTGLILSGTNREECVTYEGTVVTKNKHHGKQVVVSGAREIKEYNLSHSSIIRSARRGDYTYCGIQWRVVSSSSVINDPSLIDCISKDKPYMENNRLVYLATPVDGDINKSFTVYGVLELAKLGFNKIGLFNHVNGLVKAYGGYTWKKITHEEAELHPRGINSLVSYGFDK